ncbi:MAG: cytochrome c family protein [Gemmataceae bacterium]|nr:cytochrome c family protein [Gemmataceae bacterium]
MTPTMHAAQVQHANLNLSYVGSEKCATCHAAEYLKWKDTGHSHALEALETKAKRPGLRNFDGECMVCHTVGLGYKTGFESVEKTPHLKHVGCENCHGPGSGHMSAPNNADLLKLMSPWKQEKADRLPDVATMDKLAKLGPIERGQVAIPPTQQRVLNAVTSACMKCHDGDNDPHFDLFKYWPKVVHGQPPPK